MIFNSTFNSMQHMPLTCAYLCADCHCVGNCASHCPACASSALIGLAGVLNREESEDLTPLAFAHRASGNVARISLAA
jgi:hypothetical protein